MMRSQRTLEVAAQWVGIAVEFTHRRRDRRHDCGAWPPGRLVGTEFGEIVGTEAPAQCHQIVARVIGAKSAGGAVGKIGQVHRTATG